jgi:sugar/nucleoside kinase (ribokinase family)
VSDQQRISGARFEQSDTRRARARFDIAIAGELNLDFILYGLPEDLPAEREMIVSDFMMTLGSSSAITAHNLAVLGSRVGFASRVGPDPLGEICCRRLEEAGVDTAGVSRQKAGKVTGSSFLLPLPNSSSRRILTYPGAMFEMGREDIDVEYLSSAMHFHLSAFFLHRKLIPFIPELFAGMKAKGLTTSLDTNDDPDDEWGEVLHRTLESVDVLLCNEREVQKIARLDNAEAAALKVAKSVPLLVMKTGSRGASAFIGPKQLHVPGISVSTVDAIGAGDSFNAGFLHKWVQNADLETCLQFGNVVGALSTTRPGGTEAFRDSAHRQGFMDLHWQDAGHSNQSPDE